MGVLGAWLGLMILEVFSNLWFSDSMERLHRKEPLGAGGGGGRSGTPVPGQRLESGACISRDPPA